MGVLSINRRDLLRALPVTVVGVGSATKSVAADGYTAQNAVAVDGASGVAYVIVDGEILAIRLDDDTVLRRFSSPGGTDRGLAFGDGSLWYADAISEPYDGEIRELDPENGEVRSRIAVNYDPFGITFGDGSLWVAEVTSAPNVVHVFSPDGTETDSFSIRGPGGSTGPNGLAYFDGSLWIGTSSGLYRHTTDGELEATVDERELGYKGLSGTEMALYGPDENGDLTVLRGSGDDGGGGDGGGPEFDPAVHGFGFENWEPVADGVEEFSPPHNHQTLTEEAFGAQFDQEWVPQIKDTVPFPAPPGVLMPFQQAVYETLSESPESLYSGGHCYGMCLAARQYFEEGLPEDVPEEATDASAIARPTGEYAAVGRDIDRHHRSQMLDLKPYLLMNTLAEQHTPEEYPFDAEAEVRALRSVIEQRGTALVGVSTSPEREVDQSLHQLLAYDVKVDGDSLSSADRAVVEVYDPNYASQYYESDGNEPRELIVELSGPTTTPVVNRNEHGYRYKYERFALIGPERNELLGGGLYTANVMVSLLIRVVGNIVNVFANSPVRIDAVAPDGTELSHPDGPVDGTPSSELVYMVDAPPGDYEIRVEGTGSGEYGVNIAGGMDDGTRLDEQFSGEISEGETRTITTTVSGDSTASGGASPSGGSNDGEVDTVEELEGSDGEMSLGDLRNALSLWVAGDITFGLLVEAILESILG
jgi:hypothetical protein